MLDRIDEIFILHWKLQQKIDKDSESILNDLSNLDFFKAVSMRNHRSRGVDIQKRVIQKNGWTPVSRTEEKGDAKRGEDFIEIKSSIITPLKDSSITLRGIRGWEEINFYCFLIIDYTYFESDKITNYIFWLSKEEFENESKRYGIAKKYNLSDKASKENRNIPLGINMKIGDKNFIRWMGKYANKDIKV
mgnify:CR=1 FL=1